MRKICAITLFACFALLPVIGGAQAYITIAEMHEQPPAHWTQDYETKWRTVSIDVQPFVPQADNLPILKVVPDFRQPDVFALGEGWRSKVNDRGTFQVYLDDMEQEYGNAQKRAKGESTTTTYYPPFDMNAAYAKHNDLTLNDIINHLRLIMDTIGEDQDQWHYDRLIRVMVNSTVSNVTDEPLLPDSYSVDLQQKLHSIPVLCHVLDSVEQPKEQEMWFTTGLAFHIRTLESISFGGTQVKITDVLADDIPLCDFSKIQSAIEKEIMAGHIRKIFDVELGYALYNEPGVSRSRGAAWLQTAVFYAVPVWQVNCYYVESSTKELRDYTEKDVPERGVMEYKALIVNAQTGVVMDRSNNRKGCGDYAGFISWEKAGGKQ